MDSFSATLDVAVASVAILIDEPERFRQRAAAVAAELGTAAIPELATRLHSPSSPEPTEFGFRERGIGGWLSAWQFAIFELLFHFGTAALPLLRSVAFGAYDWTQGNAVEILVRLAAEGIDRPHIVSDLRRELPLFRHEAVLYAVGPLLEHAARDPAVTGVVRELEDLPEWRDAVRELQQE
jgi:hypothetical protein